MTSRSALPIRFSRLSPLDRDIFSETHRRFRGSLFIWLSEVVRDRFARGRSPVGAFSVRSPTATEVFNLRSKCAGLGEKIMKNTVVSNELKKEQVSHYEPKTNRCYVQLTVWNPKLTNGEENFEDPLLDGQTGQVLAKIRREKGKKSGVIYIDPAPLNGNSDELYLDASVFIGEMMEDDRQQ